MYVLHSQHDVQIYVKKKKKNMMCNYFKQAHKIWHNVSKVLLILEW